MSRKYVRKSKKNTKPLPYSGSELCFFGCGNPAKYQQSNGRLICSGAYQSCPVVVGKRDHLKNELAGMPFGYWTVKEYKRPHGWLCRCVCGVERVVRTQSLMEGISKSCGCKSFEMMSASFVKPDHQRARKSIYNNYRNAARNREHKFELSFEEFSKLIVDNCHYCGEAPSTLWPDQYIKRAAVWYQHPTDFYYNGIDRSDNAIGYIPSNCVTACKFCNRSKNTMSIGEWLAWVKRLYEFQNLKEAACGV